MFHEQIFHVFDDHIRGTDFHRLVLSRLEVFGLTDVGHETDDFIAFLQQPFENAAGVKATRIRQQNLFASHDRCTWTSKVNWILGSFVSRYRRSMPKVINRYSMYTNQCSFQFIHDRALIGIGARLQLKGKGKKSMETKNFHGQPMNSSGIFLRHGLGTHSIATRICNGGDCVKKIITHFTVRSVLVSILRRSQSIS